MEINKIIIKFKDTGDGHLKSNFSANPDTKINDLFLGLEYAAAALKEVVNKAARKAGIKNEKEFFEWLENRTYRSIEDFFKLYK